LVHELAAHPAFEVANWSVYAVGERNVDDARLITADRAVEFREDKRDAVLLLVDTATAGAGMDGIYSAAKELGERELLSKAIELTVRQLQKAVANVAAQAVARARKLGQRHTVSAFREFDFYVRCMGSNHIGEAIGVLGLWPILSEGLVDANEINVAALLTERLLLPPASSKAPSVRIASLLLDGCGADRRSLLERFLREAAGLPLREAMKWLEKHKEIWLHGIEPKFSAQSLRGIDLLSWRTTSRRVAKWSGLTESDESSMPLFIMDRAAKTAKQTSRLEVHWKTQPEDIAKGAVTYQVAVVSGDDELSVKMVEHADRDHQKVVFTLDDFPELDESAKFEAQVIITAIDVDNVEPAESEEFLLLSGTKPDVTPVGQGKTVRCAVEGIISLERREEALACWHDRADTNRFREDAKGYIVVRPHGSGKSFRIFRPSLTKEVEAQWGANPTAIARWTVRVRNDGSRVGALEMHAVGQGDCAPTAWDRLVSSSRRLCEDAMVGPGMLARIHFHGDESSKIAEVYCNAWEEALKTGSPQLALAHTVEVRALSGQTVGLIVLPSHPLRVAWQIAYDTLAQHARYDLELCAKQVIETLSALDSSHFPAMLPGLVEGATFVFGDTLGFNAVAMVADCDREPKAAIALMATCLGGTVSDIVPSVGHQTSKVLANELRHYVEQHEVNRVVRVHALRPGDGMTITRALGQSLRRNVDRDATDNDDQASLREFGFNLELYPSNSQLAVAGRFLAQLSERRRSGAGGVEAEDRWILEHLPCSGNRSIPRLRWARRSASEPDSPAHVSVAFDVFESRVVAAATVPEGNLPLHAYGLMAAIQKRFGFVGDVPQWDNWVAQQQDGEKHPVSRTHTERLNRVNTALLRSVARSLGSADGWPVLRTQLDGQSKESIAALHRLSDWVVTIDRNAGIEYFDSPREAGPVYEAYVIDCVPERDDLGCLQLVTSTTHLDEVRALLDQILAMMGLSSSLKNSEFMLCQLKALSGRLAIRLASPATESHAKTSGELVALALARANCETARTNDPCWLSLADGFFVPLDDVSDLRPQRESGDETESAARADILYVTAPTRGGLCLRFVEVKYRRHAQLARSLELLNTAANQAETSHRSWRAWYFDPKTPSVLRALRRSRLARALRFYAEKARRHHLDADTFNRLGREIDRLLTKGEDYEITELAEPDRVFIFCPEQTAVAPERLYSAEATNAAIFLFGPANLPDRAARESTIPPPAGDDTVSMPERFRAGAGQAVDVLANAWDHRAAELPLMPEELTSAASSVAAGPGADMTASGGAAVLLGVSASNEPVLWSTEITGNPHLMIVGLPGMGKTTALVNACRQLHASGIVPVVFSYHDDIDAQLAECIGPTRTLDCTSLGFNPMRVTSQSAMGHIESAGMLRDIFAAIFPELGDLQVESLRTALKSSYEDQSSGAHKETGTPPFRAFFKKLLEIEKPDRSVQTLLARLTELDDYGFFNDCPEDTGILSGQKPILVRMHTTRNEALQRAFSSFVLYRIYQDMFVRGRQNRVTHVVMFDEAHRASRLKLLPTMAKECRKYGLALVVASQEARDFDTSLFSAIANYLILRVTEHDAKALAKNIARSDIERRVADRLKQMGKYHALYFCEGRRAPVQIQLSSVESPADLPR